MSNFTIELKKSERVHKRRRNVGTYEDGRTPAVNQLRRIRKYQDVHKPREINDGNDVRNQQDEQKFFKLVNDASTNKEQTHKTVESGLRHSSIFSHVW